MATVAMIILNYNDYITTIDYVKKIRDYAVLDIIVIVDNCSTDNSMKELQFLKNNKVHLVKTEKNGGYAKGNNFGLRYLQTLNIMIDIVIVSNPDIIVEQESINRIIESILSTKNCFAMTGETYTIDNKRIGGFRYKLPTTGMIFLESSVVLRKLAWVLFGYGRRYINDEESIEGCLLKAEALPGCFFAAVFEQFQKMDFFDEHTFLYYEEDILFFKAKKKGLLSYVVPGIKIIHAEGKSIKKNIKAWRQREKIIEDSCIVYLRTCLKVNEGIIGLYKIWNALFLFGRYLNMIMRTKYN